MLWLGISPLTVDWMKNAQCHHVLSWRWVPLPNIYWVLVPYVSDVTYFRMTGLRYVFISGRFLIIRDLVLVAAGCSTYILTFYSWISSSWCGLTEPYPLVPGLDQRCHSTRVFFFPTIHPMSAYGLEMSISRDGLWYGSSSFLSASILWWRGRWSSVYWRTIPHSTRCWRLNYPYLVLDNIYYGIPSRFSDFCVRDTVIKE